ncbi:MAG: hypothetical protein QM767_24000 [Anaeromyxobacter sp.]
MDRRQRARELILVALHGVEEELSAHRYPICAEHLCTCRERLREYLASLEGGCLPPKRERPEGLGRIIVDSWGYDVPLANVILAAERAWRNA